MHLQLGGLALRYSSVGRCITKENEQVKPAFKVNFHRFTCIPLLFIAWRHFGCFCTLLTLLTFISLRIWVQCKICIVY